MNTPKCQLCGGEMKKSNQQKAGLALSLIFLGILFCLFIIGAIIGIPLIIMGLYYGGVIKYIWVCKNCGYKVERQRKMFGS